MDGRDWIDLAIALVSAVAGWLAGRKRGSGDSNDKRGAQ